MRRARNTALLTTILVLLVSFLLTDGRSQTQVSRAETPLGTEERERLLAVGKKLFMERCAKCHDERGDKPLASGPPLRERELSDDQIARAVSGRFRDKSDEEKSAVLLYIRSFMKKH